MQQTSSKPFLNQLQQDVAQTIHEATNLSEMDEAHLHFSPNPETWSVIQVLAHLKSYNRYYLPHIKRCMMQHTGQATTHFKSGWFGNYFTNMMQPPAKDAAFKKYKAPKDHQPSGDLNAAAVIAEFVASQEQLIALLERAKEKDLGKIKVPVSISRFIKLKLGDTFGFLIAHQRRHFSQIDRIKLQLKERTFRGRKEAA